MSETTPQPEGTTPEGAATGPVVRMVTQYVKDLSFENPNAPGSVRPDPAPSIDINVDVGARPLGNDHYEVELACNAKATRGDEAVFVVEVNYAGVFLIQGVPQEHFEPLMFVECPRLLFPFLRRIVADNVRDGGFMPLMLEPLDFAGMYQQQRAHADAQATAGEAPAAPEGTA